MWAGKQDWDAFNSLAGVDWWPILSGSSWGNPEVYGQELESRTFVAATQFCDIWWWYWATMAFLFSEPCRCVLSLKRINPPLGVWLWLGPSDRCPVQRFEKLVCHVTIIDFDRWPHLENLKYNWVRCIQTGWTQYSRKTLNLLFKRTRTSLSALYFI